MTSHIGGMGAQSELFWTQYCLIFPVKFWTPNAFVTCWLHQLYSWCKHIKRLDWSSKTERNQDKDTQEDNHLHIEVEKVVDNSFSEKGM